MICDFPQGRPYPRKNIGVQQNIAKAARLFQKAHTAGHSKASYSLGLMHLRGDGVEQNSAKGEKYPERYL